MNRSCKRCGASGSAVNHDAARCERCGEPRAQDGEASGIIDVRAMTSLLASERSTVREASRVRPLGPGGARLGGPVAPAAAIVDGLRPVTVRFDALGPGRFDGLRTPEAPAVPVTRLAAPNQKPLYAMIGALIVGMVSLAGYTMTHSGSVSARTPAPLLATYVAAPEPDAPHVIDERPERGEAATPEAAPEPAEEPAEVAPAARKKPAAKKVGKAPEASADENAVKSVKPEKATPAAAPVDSEPSVQCLLEPGTCKSRRASAPEPEAAPAVGGSSLPEKLESADISEGTRAGKAAAASTCKALARGGEVVKVKLSIAGPTGGVISSRAEDDGGNAALGKCCADALASSTFKKVAKAQMGALVTIKF